MAQTKNNTKKSGTGASANKKNAGKKQNAAGGKKSTAQKTEERAITPAEDNFVQQLTPYLVSLLALLLAVCIIIGEGKIGGGVRNLLAGLFSGAAYVLPVFILIRALTWRRDIEDGAFAARTACLSVVFVLLSALLHILGGGAETLYPAVHFTDGIDFVGGGVMGGLIGELLVRGFGKVCSLIILFAAMILLVLYVAGMTPRGVLIYVAYKIKVAVDKRRTRIENRRDPSRIEQKKVREEEYLEYLRDKKTRQREVIENNVPNNTPIELPSPVQAQTPAPTVYRVKKRRVVLPDEMITDGTSPEPVPEQSAADFAEEETVVSGGHIIRNTDDTEQVPESAPAKEPKKSGTANIDNGAVDERIFDEVMRRTRERIEKSRRAEGIRDESNDSVVTVDTSTGEVIETFADKTDNAKINSDVADVTPPPVSPDEIFDSMFTDEAELFDEPEDEKREPDTVTEEESTEDDEDGYDMSDIFADPDKSELIDKLSTEHRQNNGASLDVKRGVIANAALQEAPKEKATVPDYKYPPVELLTEDVSTGDDDIKEELQENAVKLVETLESFNVRTKIENISRGPTITRYELMLERGVRVRSITNLVDDISLNLATKGVRIEAPIPGKSAVGIEVPNKNQSTVHLRTLICDSRFVNAKSKLTICLGEDVAGEAVYFDIAKFPHLLIAGTTGSGKSVCINSIIMSLLYKASPEDVKMILIDPKKVELNIYNGIPHLLSPVISDPKKAAGSLSWAVAEMERRFGLIEEVGARDITAYNRMTKDDPNYEFMNRIVIIIDELADFMMTAPDEVEDSICRIAQKARAAGMHLIIGTQRPSVNVITGLIKANVPSRIAFAVSGQVDSRVILDKVGAETLIGKGDMLFSPIGAMTPTRVQGSFVSEEDVEKVVSYIKNMNPDANGVYSEEVLKQIEEEAAKCGAGKRGSAASSAVGSEDDDGAEEDPMLKPAIELAIESGKISTSFMQRKLKLGYGRAAKLIDIMEELGYVSAPDGQKARSVLITKQQYMEMVLKDEAPFE